MLSQIEGSQFPSRAEAKEAGAKRYFTGNSCPHGHIADRFTSNGRCVECAFVFAYSPTARDAANIRKRQRKTTDPEYRNKVNETNLKSYHKKVSTSEGRKEEREKTNRYWHEVHKPRVQNLMEHDKEYANKQREKARRLAKERRKRPEVKEQEKEIRKRYRQNNKAKYRYYKAMRRARTYQATPPWLNKEHKKAMRELYEERQERSEAEGIEYHVDHIIPLAFYNNVCGLHVPWNLQLLREEDHRVKTHTIEQTVKRKDFATGKMVAIYEEEEAGGS